MNTFPTFDSHQEATCFKCGAALKDQPRNSGYAPNHGAWMQRCIECGLVTFYDLPRTEEAK